MASGRHKEGYKLGINFCHLLEADFVYFGAFATGRDRESGGPRGPRGLARKCDFKLGTMTSVVQLIDQGARCMRTSPI
jgi:hypothetical protein